MKIGLISVDGHSGFPNLALMRLSAYHKARGDVVEWWDGFKRYDRVYMSKVFTFSPDVDTVINAGEIITGGTGYKDYRDLPPEVEATAPDYSIYPNFKRAVGFLTRGCIRNCPWCIVPRKEGAIRPAATWEEIKRPDSRETIFLDNNVLASEHGLEQIDRMGREKVWVDFNQGLDAMLITPETARLLAKLKWIRFVRLSCDTSDMLPVIEQSAAYLREAGVAKSRLWAYALVQDVTDYTCLCLETGQACAAAAPQRDLAPTLNCNHEQPIVVSVDCRNLYENLEMSGTLQAKGNGGQSLNYINPIRVGKAVRRLTPLECERLQGYPDGWTDIGPWRDSAGKLHRESSDSARYTALGNSIALPPWKWVLKRLCACYERDATMASLFDGIGGFPLIWERLNGPGSCLWASEIGEFPVAVTKKRFCGK